MQVTDQLQAALELVEHYGPDLIAAVRGWAGIVVQRGAGTPHVRFHRTFGYLELDERDCLQGTAGHAAGLIAYEAALWVAIKVGEPRTREEWATVREVAVDRVAELVMQWPADEIPADIRRGAV
jgi:hypothetical protein